MQCQSKHNILNLLVGLYNLNADFGTHAPGLKISGVNDLSKILLTLLGLSPNWHFLWFIVFAHTSGLTCILSRHSRKSDLL